MTIAQNIFDSLILLCNCPQNSVQQEFVWSNCVLSFDPFVVAFTWHSPEYWSQMFDYSDISFLQNTINKISSTKSVKQNFCVDLIVDKLPTEWDTLKTVYHYSVPTTKLYYPEPFIASPTFLHTDLWFSHISVYMYWLWFAFCFLITFFFITFLCTLRWCNPRMRPRRETRGVSRSKCGDLITAIVPVSWATSIIIHESTDAIDLYDGSGSNNLSVGIRAYQWGWEYYYPRAVDLNHRLYSYGIYQMGQTSVNVPSIDHLNYAHKFLNEFQARGEDAVNESAAALFVPHLNPFWLPLFDLSNSGKNTKIENSAFHSLRQTTKHVAADLIFSAYTNNVMHELDKLFSLTSDNDSTYNIKATRPHQFASQYSILNNNTTLSDLRNFNQLRQMWTKGVNYSSQIHNNATFIPWQAGASIDGIALFNNSRNVDYLNSASLFIQFKKNIPHNFGQAGLENLTEEQKLMLDFPAFLCKIKELNKIENAEMFSANNNINKAFTAKYFNTKIYKNLPNSAPQLDKRTVRAFAPEEIERQNIRRSFFNNAFTEQISSLTNTSFLQPTVFAISAAMKFKPVTVLLLNFSSEFSLSVQSPQIKSSIFSDVRNYDLLYNTTSTIPRFLHGREDMIPEMISDIYKTTWANGDSWKWRIDSASQYYNECLRNNWPAHFGYFDADSRQWSNNIAAEDMHWDGFYGSQNSDLINDVSINYGEHDEPYDKFVRYISILIRRKEFKEVIRNIRKHFQFGIKPWIEKGYVFEDCNSAMLKQAREISPLLQSDDGIHNTQTTPRNCFDTGFINSTAAIVVEDAFVAWKMNAMALKQAGGIVFDRNSNSLRVQNLFSFIDAFTATYDAPFLATNWTSISERQFPTIQLKNIKLVLSFKLTKRYTWFFASYYNRSVVSELLNKYFIANYRNTKNGDQSIVSFFLIGKNTESLAKAYKLAVSFLDISAPSSKSVIVNTEQEHTNNEIAPSDQIPNDANNSNEQVMIRSSTKTRFLTNLSHAVTSYNATQKVYRTQYDEARSNVRLRDVAMTHQPIYKVTHASIPFLSFLKKNRDLFFQPTFAVASNVTNVSSIYPLQSMLTTPTFDYPFLLAFKSDPARYLWVDWWASWGVMDIQPASYSKYALHGMPVFSKAFEFSAPENESFIEGENYLARLARVRRSLLPSWTTAPYFYGKSNQWFVTPNILEFLESTKNATNLFEDSLIAFEIIFTTIKVTDQDAVNASSQFYAANSTTWSAARKALFNSEVVNSFYYYGTQLADILTKREVMYRDLVISKNALIRIPVNYLASPQHALFKNIRACLADSAALQINVEAVRALGVHIPLSFEFYAVQTFYQHIAEIAPMGGVTEYVLSFVMRNQAQPQLNSGNIPAMPTQDISKKSQYKIIKRGVSNMLRLHATAAMAMPVLTRLHIFASSRDVIHSWAIPSAGIKIDCIPGFSSHRLAYFISSGIFWGQCMEVCGRYHHWMPIVVHFMKRDLFILWCTHFIFLKNETNLLELLERHSNDYVRTISYSSESWTNEYSKL